MTTRKVVEIEVTCQWYLLCENPATGAVSHPILGWVPTCQRCADRHNLELIPSQFVRED